MICGQCLNFLAWADQNWVLLVDDGERTTSAAAAAVSQWPPKHRKKGEELLKKLADGNRIVSMPVQHSDQEAEEVCRVTQAVAGSCRHEYVVVPNRCLCSSDGDLCHSEGAVPLDELSLASLDRHLESAMQFETGDEKRFEEKVLAPVFRTAKWVRIVDRLIVGKANQSGLECKLPPNYERGLRWVASCLAKYSDKDRLAEVTIVSEYPSKSLNSFGKQVVNEAVTRLASSLAEGLGVNIGVRLSHRLPHERFLVTDQVALDIGQGYDLLLARGNLVDCRVAMLPAREFGKVVKEYPDISGGPLPEATRWTSSSREGAGRRTAQSGATPPQRGRSRLTATS